MAVAFKHAFGSEKQFAEGVGLSELASGERNEYSAFERTTIRPTIEIVGMWGGFTGEGIKTVLPAAAHAKLACRLVEAQDPEKVQESINAHVFKSLPPGIRAQVKFMSRSKAYVGMKESPSNTVARKVLQSIYGVEPIFMREGGSIPAFGLFQKFLGGVETAILHTALKDNNVHSPNEFARVREFKTTQKAFVRALYAAAETKPNNKTSKDEL